MHLYAIIRDGKLVEKRRLKSPLRKDQIKHIGGIPQARPMQIIKPDFDRRIEVREGPTLEITNDAVIERWTVRKKTKTETDQEKTLRFERVNAQRAELCLPPIPRKVYEKFRA